MPDLPTFGRWLKDRRKALDLTQAELAAQVGCSMQLMEKLEAGSRRPSKQMAARLATCLLLPPEEQPVFIAWARTPLDPAAVEPSRRPAPAEHLRLAARLPVPLTALIGRDAEVGTLFTLLTDPAVRLLTLTGSPGIGKTRLALAVAHQLQTRHGRAVAFVPLAPVRNPALVPGAISRALGLPDTGHTPLLPRLLDYLQDRALLLFVDNFEHVSAAAPLLSQLLATAPQLQVLATSRSTLRIEGERVWRVPSLRIPPVRPNLSPAQVLEAAAAQLFVARAQALNSQFALTAAQAPVLAAVCAHLEGVPLAIELAAAHTRLYTLPALLARLRPVLPLLGADVQGRPLHQQTLRAALDWSYDLLAPANQLLLAHLAVFVGGGTIEAVEAICAGGAGSAPLIAPVAQGLAVLLEQSLVEGVPESSGRRLRLLEPIHEYAHERLTMSGESAELRRRHALYYLALAESAEPHLRGGQQLVWLACLEADLGNLRAAHQWALEQQDGELAVRLAGALGRFWAAHSHLREGRQWLDQALALGTTVAAPLRAKALNALGLLLWRLGEWEAARQTIETSLALARQSKDQQGIGRALGNLGLLATSRGEYLIAERYYRESLEHLRAVDNEEDIAAILLNLGLGRKEQGDYATAASFLLESLTIHRAHQATAGTAHVLNGLGMVAAAQGDYQAAQRYYEESLALHRQVGDLQSVAALLNNLGNAVRHLGEQQQARVYYQESLEVRRSGGDVRGLAFVLHSLSELLTEEGAFAAAASHCTESLQLRQQLGDQRGIGECLATLAEIASARQEDAMALRLLGALARLRDAMGAIPDAAERTRLEAALAQSQARLPARRWQAVWAEGQGWSNEEAVAAAQQWGIGVAAGWRVIPNEAKEARVMTSVDGRTDASTWPWSVPAVQPRVSRP